MDTGIQADCYSPMMKQFWFETVRAFGAAEYGGALFGEVLAVAQRISAGDYDNWHDALERNGRSPR